MNRADVFQGTGPTSGSYMRVKMGVTKEGRITACDATLALRSGRVPRVSREPRTPVHGGLL